MQSLRDREAREAAKCEQDMAFPPQQFTAKFKTALCLAVHYNHLLCDRTFLGEMDTQAYPPQIRIPRNTKVQVPPKYNLAKQ